MKATIAKLNRASGWRLRSDIESNLNMCRMSVSGAEIHLEAKNWESMFDELYDVIESAEKLKALIPARPNRQAEGRGSNEGKRA